MISSALRARSFVKAILAISTLITFSLSTHINVFMGFFYVADRFPFVLSLLTGIILGVFSLIEFGKSGDTKISRPVVELGLLGSFFITWTAGNAFSTPRWEKIQPGTCSSIAIGENLAFESGARTWCREILALRAFVWIEWLIVGGSFASLLAFCIRHHKRRLTHVWTTPFSQFNPEAASSSTWNAKSRAFSSLSFDMARNTGPYPFDMQTPYFDKFKTVQNQASGPAVIGYQSDPFNVSKGRPMSLNSSDEPAVQPGAWRTYNEQSSSNITLQQMQRQNHVHSTSVEHHQTQAYAY